VTPSWFFLSTLKICSC